MSAGRMSSQRCRSRRTYLRNVRGDNQKSCIRTSLTKGQTMSARRSKLSAFLAAIALIAASYAASAMGSGELRCAQPQDVADTSRSGSQSPLETARRACPLLGAIIEEFALQDLGEAFPSESIN